MDIGVGATGGLTAYLQSSSKIEALSNQTDLQGMQFDYVYDIQNRKDNYTNIALQVPIMFGIQYKRFYAMAGLKVYANVFTRSNSTATLSTYGDYAEFGKMTKMPEYQFFEEEKVSKSAKTNLNLDLDFSFEIGARLGTINYAVGYDVPKRNVDFRLAAFFDYGLIDIHNKGTLSPLKLPDLYDTDKTHVDTYVYNPDGTNKCMIDNFGMNDVMSTNGFASVVNNLVVGIKFTVLFQMPEPGQCVICRDNYRSSVRHYTSSRRGMQYDE